MNWPEKIPMRWTVRTALGLAAMVLLAACASRPPAAPPRADMFPAPLTEPMQCVPYARLASGIEIYGDAHTWWAQAAGRYARGNRPALGAVLSLPRGQRLRHGHVAVVTRILGPREIRVAHANWGNTPALRRRILRDHPAIDVSSGNNWSAVRFWNYEAASYGGVYPADGFIYRNR